MKGYIYNVTVSADRSCSNDVLFYVAHKLFPAWQEREGWEAGRLLLIPTPVEDGTSVAIQFELSDREMLLKHNLSDDPLIQRILEVYGQKVYFYPTLMEIIK